MLCHVARKRPRPATHTKMVDVSSFMEEWNKAADEVWKEMGWPNLQNITSANVQAFKSMSKFAEAVDWTEPLMLSLYAFYLILGFVAFKTRKNFNIQGIIWLCIRKLAISPIVIISYISAIFHFSWDGYVGAAAEQLPY